MKATAAAHPNIALIKYWGKRDQRLVLPHQSSLSVTLAPLSVMTTVEFQGRRGSDEIEINGREATGPERKRVQEIIRLVRWECRRAPLGAVRMRSRGDFPASAGLASSAAGFAALAVAARVAAGLERDVRAESMLARRGSGSASRSIDGGFVRWNRGRRADGRDSFGEQLFAEGHWPQLRLLVAMVSREEKAVKSRDGMRSTVETSPFYVAWAKAAERECKEMARLVKRRDLEGVGGLAERNAWRMHATALGADPPLCYLRPATLSVIEACQRMREEGLGVWFTLDAGPNPVLLTSAKDEAQVAQLVQAHGATEVIHCSPGGGARLLDSHLL